MAKKKKAFTLNPWLSAHQDCCEKRFIRVGSSLFASKKYLSLSNGAKHTYLAMAMHAAGNRGFTFPRKEAERHGITKSSFFTYVRELEEKGFLIRHSNKNLRTANYYEFSFEWRSKP